MSMDMTEPARVVREGLDAWHRRDYEAAMRFVAADLVVECKVGVLDLDGVYEGPGEMARWLTSWWNMFEDGHTEIEELSSQGNVVMFRTTHRGTGRSSGVRSEFTHWQVCRVEDGQVRHWWQVRTEADAAAIAAAIGQGR
jgi:limonene-1,2-epoxide hydrolase